MRAAHARRRGLRVVAFALARRSSNAKSAQTRMWACVFMLLGNVLFALVFGEVILAMSNTVRSRDMFAQRVRRRREREPDPQRQS